MSDFMELPGLSAVQRDFASPAGAVSPGHADESFVFVSRKKKGRKQESIPLLARTHATETLAKTSEMSQAPLSNSLPGWTSRKPGKIKKNSQRAKMLGLREERTMEWGLSMIEDRLITLKQSKFYKAFEDLVRLTLSPPCKRREHAKHAMNAQDQVALLSPSSLEENLAPVPLLTSALALSESGNQAGSGSTERIPIGQVSATTMVHAQIPITDMVFYGIGSIEASRNSQFQLALGLCLRDILQVTGTISIFDPIMTDFDKDLVDKLGLSVLRVNEQAKHALDSRTLLYMPHCPKGLYSHMLESNWSRDRLDKLVILGNRFTMYDESPSFRQLTKQAPFILPALSIACISPLPAIKFEDNTIFNDLAIHMFPPDKSVPEVDVLDREVDPEIL